MYSFFGASNVKENNFEKKRAYYSFIFGKIHFHTRMHSGGGVKIQKWRQPEDPGQGLKIVSLNCAILIYLHLNIFRNILTVAARMARWIGRFD